MEVVQYFRRGLILRFAYKSSLSNKILSQDQSFNSEVYKHKGKKDLTMNRRWMPNLLKLDNGCNKTKNYRLLSYNILAQDLLIEHLHLYFDIDNKLLRWESRIEKIKDEISIIDPDILCLQEMQYDHLKQLVKLYNVEKQNRKFEYIFKKKTGARSDGCIIIYDKKKFKLVSEKYVEYYTVGVQTLNRENIAVMVKFQPIDNIDSVFVVATTHLLYNPKREDVRISQVNKLIQSIIEFSAASRISERSNRLPVILTGDFNFTPSTHAFEMLTSFRNFNVPSEKRQGTQTADYSFKLEAIDLGYLDTASTYQRQWITVDYILKSRSRGEKTSIQINSLYLLPSLAECFKNGKIPNELIGSDHFLIAIQFITS